MSAFSLDDSGFGMDQNPFSTPDTVNASSQSLKDIVNNDNSSVHDVDTNIVKESDSNNEQGGDNDAMAQLTVEERVVKAKNDFMAELIKMKDEGNALVKNSEYEKAMNTYERCYDICNTYFKGTRQLLNENPIVLDAISKDVLEKMREELNWYSIQDINTKNENIVKLLNEEQLSKLDTAHNYATMEIDEVNEFRVSLILNSALCHVKLRQFQNGIKACSRALELNPNSVKALLRRSKCYEEVGNYDLARQDIEKIQEIEPNSSVAINALRNFEKELKNQKKKELSSFKGILRGASRKDTTSPKSRASPIPPVPAVPSQTTSEVATTQKSPFRRYGSVFAIGIGILATIGISAYVFKRISQKKN